MTEQEKNPDFDELLEFIKSTRGFNFTGYKRNSLMRRFRKRMQQINMDSFSEYMDYLQVKPDEFTELFNTVLINVTRFFRDIEAWQFLKDEVIPRILDRKGENQTVRVWSVGCSTGQEAYSLAILLAEAMGKDHFKRRAKVYATDVDEPAIAIARHAAYSPKDLEDVPEQYRDKYFKQSGPAYVFDNVLRRSIIFGVHDVVQAAPISRLDLLVCRNTLMYFNSETQNRIIARFHFALNEGGALFLGMAETMLTRTGLFKPVNQKLRLFAKTHTAAIDHAYLLQDLAVQEEVQKADERKKQELHDGYWKTAFEDSPAAQIMINPDGAILSINKQAVQLFNMTESDIGRPFHEFAVSYRPIEMRPAIQQAALEKQPVHFTAVEHRVADRKPQYLDIHVIPLFDQQRRHAGTNIVFADVTSYRAVQKQVEDTNVELEHAYEDLQSANEQVETTNMDLQSTVEELETANEELQSSNEEMETMNEELLATNEELQTINDECRERTDELNQLNAFRESILSSVPMGIIVLDPSMTVTTWNQRSEDLLGLRADEVRGKFFLNLDIALPVEKLKNSVLAVLEQKIDIREVQIQCLNRRGKQITVRVVCTPLKGQENKPAGAILVMEELPLTAEEAPEEK